MNFLTPFTIVILLTPLVHSQGKVPHLEPNYVGQSGNGSISHMGGPCQRHENCLSNVCCSVAGLGGCSGQTRVCCGAGEACLCDGCGCCPVERACPQKCCPFGTVCWGTDCCAVEKPVACFDDNNDRICCRAPLTCRNSRCCGPDRACMVNGVENCCPIGWSCCPGTTSATDSMGVSVPVGKCQETC